MTEQHECRLDDAPIGLFWHGDTLALKTEYRNNEGRIDAYIVSSGEFFWGLPPQTIESQNNCLVRPVSDAESRLNEHKTLKKATERLSVEDAKSIATYAIPLAFADALMSYANTLDKSCYIAGEETSTESTPHFECGDTLEDCAKYAYKLEIENEKLEDRRLHWWRLACRRFGMLCDLRELLKEAMFAHQSGWFDLDLLDRMKEATTKEK